MAGETVSRETLKSVFVGSVGLHVAEGAFAYLSARSGGVAKPGKWARSTVLWGFPVLLRLRKAKRLAAA